MPAYTSAGNPMDIGLKHLDTKSDMTESDLRNCSWPNTCPQLCRKPHRTHLLVEGKAPRRPWLNNVVLQAVADGISPSHQACPGWGADGHGVVLGDLLHENRQRKKREKKLNIRTKKKKKIS